ncbi:hypothetical protein BHE74_00037481 [Ensete ventricosum]|uniref:Uncharacterized protein n=1 Tax=Ensete ventricosum TaxID=4639 RepID=A0A426Z891_ENSVE|nr:hypothetical protein B296_00036302 [Ensete ventricosum]RWW26103.1 hypothetical protein GW17_00009534 [Ensete ventricosum]RWW55843.1 hypothetical protein BHE74_00037481 [Ensete ventricosum]RZS13604.1 hypothetical protein BHM03_00045235 [Ensete ventricosum]
MDRYQRVEKPRPQSAAIGENEIRITTQGLIRNYVNYATSLLQVEEEEEAGEEEDMVGTVDMATIRVVMVDIATIKEDIVATTVMVDMVAMKTTKVA